MNTTNNQYCDEFYIQPCYKPGRRREIILILRKLLSEVENYSNTSNRADVVYKIFE